MNFEIVDNFFQVFMLLVGAIWAGVYGFKVSISAERLKSSGDSRMSGIFEKNSRMCMTLAFGYISFMLGTLFYVLHIAVFSDITRTFYVSEISWTAAYIFFISFQLMREEGMKKQSRTPLVCIPVVFFIIMYIIFFIDHNMPAPRVVFLAVLMALLMIMGILAVRGIHRNRGAGRSVMVDVLFALVSVLQIMLYLVSAFISDYTHFNLYFAVDMTLTLSMTGVSAVLTREFSRETEVV